MSKTKARWLNREDKVSGSIMVADADNDNVEWLEPTANGQVFGLDDEGNPGFFKASGGLDWSGSIQDDDFNAEGKKGYFIDTTTSSVVLNFPADAPVGTEIGVRIIAHTNQFILLPTNAKVEGYTSMVWDHQRAGASFVMSGDPARGWVMVSNASNNIAWTTASENTIASTNTGYLVDTRSQVVEITLPSAPVKGDIISICDSYGVCSVNNITLKHNGKPIYGQIVDYTLDVDNISLTMVYVDDIRGWVNTDHHGSSTIWRSEKVADFSAVPGDGYFVNTSNGAVTMTLPTSPKRGSTIWVRTTIIGNSFTIAGGGSKIEGNDSLVWDYNRAGASLVYSGTILGWVIVTEINSDVSSIDGIAWRDVTGETTLKNGEGANCVSVAGDFIVHFPADPIKGVTQVAIQSSAGNASEQANPVVIDGNGKIFRDADGISATSFTLINDYKIYVYTFMGDIAGWIKQY